MERRSHWNLSYGRKSQALEDADGGLEMSCECSRSGWMGDYHVCLIFCIPREVTVCVCMCVWRCDCLWCYIDLRWIQLSFISFGLTHQSPQISWHLFYPHCSAGCLQALTDRWVLEKQHTHSPDSKQEYKVSLFYTYTQTHMKKTPPQHTYSSSSLAYFLFLCLCFPLTNSIFFLPTHWISLFSCIWFLLACACVCMCVNVYLCALALLCIYFADCRVSPRWLIAHWARYRADQMLSTLSAWSHRQTSGSPMIGALDYSLLWTTDQFSPELLPSWDWQTDGWVER